MKKFNVCLFVCLFSAVFMFAVSCNHNNGTENKKKVLHIKKISLEKETKENEGILSEVTFTPVSLAIAHLDVQAQEEGVNIEFEGLGEKKDGGWDWMLTSGENTIKIKLKKGDAESEYTVKVKSRLQAVGGVYQLNGLYAYQIKNDFDKKIIRKENPLYEANCNHLRLAFITEVEYSKLIVNGVDVELPQGKGLKSSEKLFMLKGTDEEQFTVLIVPKQELLSTYAPRFERFRVKGTGKKAIVSPYMEINGNGELPKTFLENLAKEGQMPLYNVFKGPAHLIVSISPYAKKYLVKEIKVNDEVQIMEGKNTYIEKEIAIQSGNATPVKVEFVSKNNELAENLVWNFKLQEGGEKPVVFGVKLVGVNDVGIVDGAGVLPKSFTEHVSDGSNPLYKFAGHYAKLSIYSEKEDFVEKAIFKLDGNDDGEESVIEESWGFGLIHTCDIKDENEHQIEIQIIPQDTDIHAPLNMKFRLQRSNEKIPLRQTMMEFSINGVEDGNMPREVKEHLIDGTSPLYEIDGEIVNARLLIDEEFVSERIKHVIVNFEGEAPKILELEARNSGFGTYWIAESSFIMQEVKKPYMLKVDIVPNDEQVYSGFSYSLNIQNTGAIVDMPIAFIVDEQRYQTGSYINAKGSDATIIVGSSFDVMKSVNITVAENTENSKCEIKEEADGSGGTIYYASKKINLVDGENTPEYKIEIKVQPKNEAKYKPATCNWTIKGTKLEKNNAKFEVDEDGEQRVEAEVKYKEGVKGAYANSYGATHINFTASTQSPKATVRYALLGLGDELIDFIDNPTSQKYKIMQNDNGEHKSEKITLFDDKPTRIKIYVVAEDGSEDEEDGLYTIDCNPVALRFSYSEKTTDAEFTDFEHEGYGEVVLKKSSINDAKPFVYFAVRVWSEDAEGSATKVGNSNLAEGQNAFEKLEQTDDEKDKDIQTYMSRLNVSKLKSGETQELEFKCNLRDAESGADAFTYILKVKIAD